MAPLQYLTSQEIRKKFIDYFVSHGHTHVESSSLVPYDDQTLLFTNAGMVQFKNVFPGLEQRPYSRAVTVQRCLRAGGKHNDLDTVGRTARHHTFFEMLGNFSFGDYFKKEAIVFCWDFITNVLGLPKDKLYATVYEKDDEAFELWENETDIDPRQILRIGEKDNFWAMGPCGPCGPCSEIFIDRGAQYTCDNPVCGIGHCDCDRFMEIWNLVFMQFNRDEEGVLHPLPRPSIDTGMGLERLAAVLQKVDSNYETDVMRVLLDELAQLCHKEYHSDERGFAFRVIVDHARACTFLIADGVMPSNEGRGYVLRRILRRAVRFGKTLGFNEPFLHKMVDGVCRTLGETYPVIEEKKAVIKKMIKMEEERFLVTLNDGLMQAEEMIACLKKSGASEIGGQEAFTLYDTYGFPLDLTKDVAEEHQLTVDEAGFEAAMQVQRDQAREARSGGCGGDDLADLAALLVTDPLNKFVGYQTGETITTITNLIVDNKKMAEVGAQETGWLVLKDTPFYAEGGGQMADVGCLTTHSAVAEILDSQKLVNGLMVQKFIVQKGKIRQGDEVTASVNMEMRHATAANHSATHLLNQALRSNLGDHVQQAGSLVDENRLRFDFSYFCPLTAEDLERIEADVNEQIFADLAIDCQEMSFEEAKTAGALAFFGDKYGDVVRVVNMGDYSRELCGGIHCAHTGQIGLFKIVSESGVAAGLRRIEALTGQEAVNYYKKQEAALNRISDLLKTPAHEVEKRLHKLLEENKQLHKELEQFKGQKAEDSLGELKQQIEEIAGLKCLVAEAKSIEDMNTLRGAMDHFREQGVDVLVLFATDNKKVYLVTAISNQGQAKGLYAGDLIKEIAPICGGGGGGKKDLAQAGGKNPEKIIDAVCQAQKIIAEKLS
ncbi:MAG: alanine--tRNA ligase [Bacillota bacterium]